MDIKCLTSSIRSQLRSGFSVNNFKQCLVELVLNSLDAKSTAIAIRINLVTLRIQVVDNGFGISKEGMLHVATRYATSKFNCLEDLEKKVKHFGYRGEALVSIASFSKKLTITSRAKDSEKTYCKTLKNCKWSAVEKTVCRSSQGTTVTVENFLYNMPIRKEQIKPHLDLEEIRVIIECLTFINPKVSFSIRDDVSGKIILQSSKVNTVAEAILNVYRDINIDNLDQFQVTKNKINVTGLIYKYPYPSNKLQITYINKRPFQSLRIFKAINKMLSKSSFYKRNDILEHGGDNVVYFFNISCPYSLVDIMFENSKTSVEFKNWEIVLKCIEKLIKRFLEQERLIDIVNKNKQEPHRKISDYQVRKTGSDINISEIRGAFKSIPVTRKKTDLVQYDGNFLDKIININEESPRRSADDELPPMVKNCLKEASNDDEEARQFIVPEVPKEKKTIFDRHNNTQSLVINSEIEDDVDDELVLEDTRPHLEDPQRKGKELLLDFFLKSAVAYRSDSPKSIFNCIPLENFKKPETVITQVNKPSNNVLEEDDRRTVTFSLNINTRQTIEKSSKYTMIDEISRKIRTEQKEVEVQTSEIHQGNGENCDDINDKSSKCIQTTFQHNEQIRTESNREFKINFNFDGIAVDKNQFKDLQEITLYNIFNKKFLNSNLGIHQSDNCCHKVIHDCLCIKDKCNKYININNDDECYLNCNHRCCCRNRSINEKMQNIPKTKHKKFNSKEEVFKNCNSRCDNNRAVDNCYQNICCNELKFGCNLNGNFDHKIKKCCKCYQKSNENVETPRYYPDQTNIETEPVLRQNLLTFDSHQKYHLLDKNPISNNLNEESFICDENAKHYEEEHCSSEINFMIDINTKTLMTKPAVSCDDINNSDQFSKPITTENNFIEMNSFYNKVDCPEMMPCYNEEQQCFSEKEMEENFICEIESSKNEDVIVKNDKMNFEESNISVPINKTSASDDFILNRKLGIHSPFFAKRKKSITNKSLTDQFFVKKSLKKFHSYPTSTFIDKSQRRKISEKFKVQKSTDVEIPKATTISVTDFLKKISSSDKSKDDNNKGKIFCFSADEDKNVEKKSVDSKGTQEYNNPNHENSKIMFKFNDNSKDKVMNEKSQEDSLVITLDDEECKNLITTDINENVRLNEDVFSLDVENNRDIDEHVFKSDENEDVQRLNEENFKKFELKLKQDQNCDNFNFANRISFIPKGLSPIMDFNTKVETELSQNSKNTLLFNILHCYENELKTIKWEKLKDEKDIKALIDKVYEEQCKKYDEILPVSVPTAMQRCSTAFTFSKSIFEDLKVIGQIDKKFIVVYAEIQEILIIIDQHAAHERVRLESLIDAYKENKDDETSVLKLKRQYLEKKVSIKLSCEEVKLLSSKKICQHFQNLGLIYNLSKKTAEISAIPNCLYKKLEENKDETEKYNMLTAFISSFMLEELEFFRKSRCLTKTIPKFLINIINMEACRGAIKFGDTLTNQKCSDLLKSLSFCKLPFQCAHGRPTMIPLTEMAKMSSSENEQKLNFGKLTELCQPE